MCIFSLWKFPKIELQGFNDWPPCNDMHYGEFPQLFAAPITKEDHRKEMQTAVVWSCLPFIRSGQNHLARHSKRGKKTRQTEEEVGRQHQGMDRLWVQKVLEGSGKQGKMEETGCKFICGAPTTLAVKELMMMMMNQHATTGNTPRPPLKENNPLCQ